MIDVVVRFECGDGFLVFAVGFEDEVEQASVIGERGFFAVNFGMAMCNE
jgi:hypothetical protein